MGYILYNDCYVAKASKDWQQVSIFSGGFNTDVFQVFSVSGSAIVSGKAEVLPAQPPCIGGIKASGVASTQMKPVITFTGGITVSGDAITFISCSQCFDQTLVLNDPTKLWSLGGFSSYRHNEKSFTSSDSKFPTIVNSISSSNSKGNMTLSLPTGTQVGDMIFAVFASRNYCNMVCYHSGGSFNLDSRGYNWGDYYNNLWTWSYIVTSTSEQITFDVQGGTPDSEIAALVAIRNVRYVNLSYSWYGGAEDNVGTDNTITISPSISERSMSFDYGLEILVGCSNDNNTWGSYAGITTEILQVANATGTDNSLFIAYRKVDSDNTFPSTISATLSSLGPDQKLLGVQFVWAHVYNSNIYTGDERSKVIISGAAVTKCTSPIIRNYVGVAQLNCHGAAIPQMAGAGEIETFFPIPFTKTSSVPRTVRQIKNPSLYDRV